MKVVPELFCIKDSPSALITFSMEVEPSVATVPPFYAPHPASSAVAITAASKNARNFFIKIILLPICINLLFLATVITLAAVCKMRKSAFVKSGSNCKRLRIMCFWWGIGRRIGVSVPPAGDFLCAQKVTKDAQETKVS